MDKICFERPTFNMYMFVLLCVIGYLIYFKLNSSENINIKDSLYKSIINMKDQLYEQKCEMSLHALQQIQSTPQLIPQSTPQSMFLNKILNPLSGTSPINPQGTFSTPRYNGFKEFQQLGFISGPNGRYPVMGRYRDAGRTDRFQYYTIDNERGRIKINFKTKNDNELFDGDLVNINELGGEFTFKKYEDQDYNRYDPTVL